MLPNQERETDGEISMERWNPQLRRNVKCDANTHTLSKASGERRPPDGCPVLLRRLMVGEAQLPKPGTRRLILPNPLVSTGGSCYSVPRLTDEETEAQRGGWLPEFS